MNERERFERASAIFLEASRLPPESIDAFLADRCAGDAELAAMVRQLLSADRQGTAFRTLAGELSPVHGKVREELADLPTMLESSSSFGVDRYVELPVEAPGDQIGRYKLLELIGEGGFGRVWAAEQLEPVRRRVALKVIKVGMDTRQVVARFTQERQALAVMDHPNIAKVLDAGATTTGRPYFVMELCKGSSISAYCDANQLSIEQRLELFEQVCAAVQHAHTKGVIHRDLKPTNILVATQDGRPHAKVIDFGIAKATDQRLTEKTLFTEHRQLIGTPEYMSPEQAEGSLDIDTRTDVYSLGVLLYELLTGTTPFSGQELRSAAFGELQRIIREVDPPRPSTRLTQSSDTIASVAAARRTQPNRLGTIVRGELDWIVMKALEKDRARRYQSAGALAQDIGHLRAGQPVLAAPPSRTYRAIKFYRRHRIPVLAASLLLLGLAGALVIISWQARLATEQRDRAIAAERVSADRAAELEQVANFQSDMLAQVDPAASGLRLISDLRNRLAEALKQSGASDTDAQVRIRAFMDTLALINTTDTATTLIDAAIMKPAVAALDQKFTDRPVLDARLRATLAERSLDLGQYKDALALFEQVAAVRSRELGADDPATLEAILGKARLLIATARYADAEATIRPILAKLQSSRGDSDSLTILAMNRLAESLAGQDKYPESESILRDAIEHASKINDPLRTLALIATENLANNLRLQGKLDEAERYELLSLEGHRAALGPTHPSTLLSMNNLGALQYGQRRFAEAEATFRQTAEARRQRLGENHPDTLQTFTNLAATLNEAGKGEESLALSERILQSSRDALGADHTQSLNALNILVVGLINAAQYDKAEPLAKELVERSERVTGPNGPSTLIAYNVTGYLYNRQGRPAEVEPYIRKAVAASTVVYGEDHPERLTLVLNLGSNLATLGRSAEAIPFLREVRERGSRVLTPDDDRMLAAAVSLSTALRDTNASAEAEPLLRETLELRTRKLGPGHPSTILDAQRLASTLLNLDRFQESVDVLKGPIEEAAKLPPADGARITPRLLVTRGLARAGLAAASANPAEFAAAEADLLDAHARYSAAAPSTESFIAQTAEALADLHTAWHKAEPDKGHDAKAAEWKAKADPATPDQNATGSK
jgi:eukaryotic-like serine/threonine-protein kinase